MAKFISKYSNYQVLVKPTFLEVKNGIPILNRGEKIVFENYEYVTENKKAIEFLREHEAYGVDFIEDKQQEEEELDEPENTGKPVKEPKKPAGDKKSEVK